jgi:hypothetical protein
MGWNDTVLPPAWPSPSPPSLAPPPAGGSTNDAPADTPDGWEAFHIQLVSAALAVVCLAVFGLREVARRYGVRLRLLYDAQTNVVLRVITQEPDEAQAALVTATTPLSAHRSDVYLPPLAPPLLAELGLTAHERRAAVESVRDVVHAASVAAEKSALETAGRRANFVSPAAREHAHSAGCSGRTSAASIAGGVGGGAHPCAVHPCTHAEPMSVVREVALDRSVTFDQMRGRHERQSRESTGGLSPPRSPRSRSPVARSRSPPPAPTPRTPILPSGSVSHRRSDDAMSARL